MSEIKTLNKVFLSVEEILRDYQLAIESREASLLGRKEVFMGKAKFGIFGDGKEIAQIAMAKVFKKGDWRSGYYRDQTFMMAIGELTVSQYFAQLYAHTDVEADPATAGRLMNSHFATRFLDHNGNWLKQVDLKNSAADISCTAGQIPRLLGLAYASKLYRINPELKGLSNFSNDGNEIAFGTIGNASTSEGHFFEMMNAAGVLQVPLVISVWDDNYGISVPNEYHTTKGSISKILEGFQRDNEDRGFEIMVANGWDYEGLCKLYRKAEAVARLEHVPVLVHVKEMTQPQGHSTSGSHERYKSKERLEWEKEFDPIRKMREWILENDLTSSSALEKIESKTRKAVKEQKNEAWNNFMIPIRKDVRTAVQLLNEAARSSNHKTELTALSNALNTALNPVKMDVHRALRKGLRHLLEEDTKEKARIKNFLNQKRKEVHDQYHSHLYSESANSALNVEVIAPIYGEESELVDGREVLRACFDKALTRDPRIFAFGEDVGMIGDVNQGFAGLQAVHGKLRVTDTSIRETTIVGQGIGAAMRGLRPIAEIQYLDYLLYGLQTLSDDLATLQYRTKGGQKAPVIIRTRGHRLEGVWHSGSPMGMILNSLKGMLVLVPRNMTQASGMYNTLFKSDDPALIIESLNGYRLKERMPENVDSFTVPLGIPEILREGEDVTIVTYGSMCRMVVEAARQLAEFGISCEVIDVQTLIPFDRTQVIGDSLKKTNRIIFADEDVPGGATGFMMQQVLEKQDGYRFLDSKPVTISAESHRPAYGSDGDYFSKPSVEDIFEKTYALMSETDPGKHPPLY